MNDAELRQLQHDIKGMRNSINDLGKINIERIKEVEDLNKKMDSILLLLLGHEAQPQTGILRRLEKIELFIDMLEKTKQRLSGSIATTIFIITAFGAALGVAFKVIDYLHKK